MYSPASFQVSDRETLHAFIRQHSFATLISQGNDGPWASHLPLLLDDSIAPWGRLRGHMARANPHWQLAGTTCLAIFHGPHAYISPAWYLERDVVPTWNYTVVHAYGTLRLLDDAAAIRNLLEDSVAWYESSRTDPWSTRAPAAEFLDRLQTAIVGFEIDIERVEGKWKLSQNHSRERRERVIAALEQSPRADEQAVAEQMRAVLPPAP